ncbi:hypothetical protein Lalb_Chr10g0099211 [Lupinus albus]|uniref:Uncharacterized protein n=1 Tax=Lupinus albus TaxID=3870 RepID=A0A6A4PWC8_LUPAL|nr:hypothetical protein Lalb_Chr10g0099211 [Lupinus albus]
MENYHLGKGKDELFLSSYSQYQSSEMHITFSFSTHASLSSPALLFQENSNLLRSVQNLHSV